MTDDIPPVPSHDFATPAEVAELCATIAELIAERDRLLAERPYIVGANDGWDAAVEQGQTSEAVKSAMVRFWKRLAEIHLSRAEKAEATIAALEARVEALTGAAQAIQENANGSFEMDDGERGYLVHSDDMDRLKNVVSRKRSVLVPRCTAETTARLYSQPHQCPYAAVVQIDGDWLCQKHADLLAQAEGRAALSGDTPDA